MVTLYRIRGKVPVEIIVEAEDGEKAYRKAENASATDWVATAEVEIFYEAVIHVEEAK